MVQVIVLAVVQGITEFLPISSSGHLVVLAALMGRDVDVKEVNIVLHAGTLLSILVFFWARIWGLLKGDIRTIGLLIVGTLPAGVIGIWIRQQYAHILEDPLLAGFMLIATGVILWWASRQSDGVRTYQQLSIPQSLWIGAAQAAALLPGISRSGSTIASGLAMGLSRRDAATFSFLLAIPAIGGASLLEVIDVVQSPESMATDLSVLLVGATLAFVVGLISLWWLLRWLEGGRLERFSYWCIPLGFCVIVWQLATR